jgi:hypothetical protein
MAVSKREPDARDLATLRKLIKKFGRTKILEIVNDLSVSQRGPGRPTQLRHRQVFFAAFYKIIDGGKPTPIGGKPTPIAAAAAQIHKAMEIKTKLRSNQEWGPPLTVGAVEKDIHRGLETTHVGDLRLWLMAMRGMTTALSSGLGGPPYISVKLHTGGADTLNQWIAAFESANADPVEPSGSI